VVRNAHASSPPTLLQLRHAMTYMRGTMTRVEIRRARGVKEPERPEPPPATAPTNGAVKTVGPFASPSAAQPKGARPDWEGS
jgi:hypothetical protein